MKIYIDLNHQKSQFHLQALKCCLCDLCIFSGLISNRLDSMVLFRTPSIHDLQSVAVTLNVSCPESEMWNDPQGKCHCLLLGTENGAEKNPCLELQRNVRFTTEASCAWGSGAMFIPQDF